MITIKGTAKEETPRGGEVQGVIVDYGNGETEFVSWKKLRDRVEFYFQINGKKDK